MVYSGSDSSSDDAPRLDAVFGALGHPARRAIVRDLATRASPPRMNTVAAEHRMSPQLLNKHVAILERSGLVSRKGRSRQRHLVLDPRALDAAHQWIEEIRTFWEHQLDTLDAYIAELSRDDGSDTDPEEQAT